MARKTIRVEVDKVKGTPELLDVLAFSLFALVAGDGAAGTDWLNAETKIRNEYRDQALSQLQRLQDMGVDSILMVEATVKSAARNIRTRPASEAYHENEYVL